MWKRLSTEPDFWELHGTQVIAIVIVISTLLAAIIILLVSLERQRRKRIHTEEEALRQLTALAHVTRLGSVGELTASIVHEINQPLGAIMANTDAAAMMLSNQPSPDNELKAILRDIREDNLRASQIIQKLRMLLTKRTLESSPVSINNVIDTIKSLLGNLAIKHHVTIQLRLDKDLPLIMGDSTHLQQILINLAANAMEAMSQLPPPQRILTVSTAVNKKGNALLIVSDSGPGIPTDTLPHIFESFYTTKPEGMGMGLAIVQTIVEAHHSHIEAFNNPQGGATFEVRFPAAEVPELQHRYSLQEQ